MLCDSSKPKNEKEEGFQPARVEPFLKEEKNKKESEKRMREEEKKLSESPVKKFCLEDYVDSDDGSVGSDDSIFGEFSREDFIPFHYSTHLLAPFEDYNDELYVMLRQSSKNAIAEYNKENGTNYKFSGYVETVYKIRGGGVEYCVTFEAKQPPNNEATTFKATIYQQFGKEPELDAYSLVD